MFCFLWGAGVNKFAVILVQITGVTFTVMHIYSETKTPHPTANDLMLSKLFGLMHGWYISCAGISGVLWKRRGPMTCTLCEVDINMSATQNAFNCNGWIFLLTQPGLRQHQHANKSFQNVSFTLVISPLTEVYLSTHSLFCMIFLWWRLYPRVFHFPH